MKYVYLEKVAEEIAKREKAGNYTAEVAFKEDLHKSLRTAALQGEIAVYNPNTGIKYIPGEYEWTIFTTPDAVNDWLKFQGVSYRYDTKSNTDKPAPLLTGSEYAHKFSAIVPANYEIWCKADLWTIERAILLMINAETLPGNNYYSSGRCDTETEQAIRDKFMEIWKIAEGSLIAGTLSKAGKGFPSLLTLVKPLEFIAWARSKGYEIPAELDRLTKSAEQEPQVKAINKLSLDDELDTILDNGLHKTFNELKQRNEALYDGVLGFPPESVTKNTHRFESIRNRLLDEDGLTVSEIRGLISDCQANTLSFSHIPDELKQDIRFLASLLPAANPNKPNAEGIGAANNSNQKPSTTSEVYECLKLLVKDENKLWTLLFKNASKTKWLSECALGDGYNLPMVIKAHSKKGLLKEEYQKRFSEDSIEKTLSVN